MKIMDRTDFRFYSLFGSIFAFFACLIFSQVIAPRYSINPAYSDFLKQYQMKAEQLAPYTIHVKQRQFEEALVGLRNTDTLDPDLREVALAILEDKQKSGNYTGLEEMPRRILNGRLKGWNWQKKEYVYRTFDGIAVASEEVSILKSPDRLFEVLKGNRTAIRSAPDETPAEMKLPTWPDSSPKTVQPPAILPWIGWAAVSLVFALVFTITGLVVNGSHPLATFPDFALGWLVIVTALPGFALMYSLRAMTLDARPALAHLKKFFFREGNFADEYDKFVAQLDAMKERATRAGDQDMLGRIEATLEKVRMAQDRERLGQLRRSLENIDHYLTGIAEIERDVGA